MIDSNMEPMTTSRTITFALALGLGASMICAAPVQARELVGKKKADEACAACHGPEGNKPVTAETPRLAGQQDEYLVRVLMDYRSGKRDNAIMAAMAKPLSDKEIRDLALYYSEQRGLTTKP